jgi:murein DD-endopeptidase MepM/ murein hydrolase activator NlpD
MTPALAAPHLRHLRLVAVCLTVALTGIAATRDSPAALAAPEMSDGETRADAWSWPLAPTPPLVESFDLPDQLWSSGHRGIDLAGQVGQPVLAVDDGTVTYAGVLAGRGVVVVAHGAVRSTYEPVSAAVSQGDPVSRGQVLGVLQAVQSHCLPAACLHLGARQSDAYLDPEPLFGSPRIRLKPMAGLAGASSRGSPASGLPWAPPVGPHAPVTSGFGPRVHPLTGQSGVHDGVDYGVDCGTPIAAAAAGTVVRAAADPIYGHQIIVEHADGMETRYGHMFADGVHVGVGDHVRAGQIIGAVGSDGWSTGCHLHVTVASHGRPVAPLTFVGP